MSSKHILWCLGQLTQSREGTKEGGRTVNISAHTEWENYSDWMTIDHDHVHFKQCSPCSKHDDQREEPSLLFLWNRSSVSDFILSLGRCNMLWATGDPTFRNSLAYWKLQLFAVCQKLDEKTNSFIIYSLIWNWSLGIFLAYLFIKTGKKSGNIQPASLQKEPINMKTTV